jgi:hypothetical protein
MVFEIIDTGVIVEIKGLTKGAGKARASAGDSKFSRKKGSALMHARNFRRKKEERGIPPSPPTRSYNTKEHEKRHSSAGSMCSAPFFSG